MIMMMSRIVIGVLPRYRPRSVCSKSIVVKLKRRMPGGPPSLPRLSGVELGGVFLDELLLLSRETLLGSRHKIPAAFSSLWPKSQRFPAAGANVRLQTRSRPDGLHF
jgi:hypothetical protein